MKKLFFGCLIVWFFFQGGSISFSEELPPLPKGPLRLTSCRPEHWNPEYWIRKLPNPHKVLKTSKERKAFNRYIDSLIREKVDVFEFKSSRSGKDIKDDLEKVFKALRARKLYDVQNQDIPKDFFDTRIKPQVQWDKVPTLIKVQWAAANRQTSVRALPTDFKMLEKPNDPEFDQLQFTQIKLWTPVVIYHKTKNGEWSFIQAPYARGWVKSKDLTIFPSRDELKKYVYWNHFLVVTGEIIPVFSDSGRNKIKTRISMGTTLPYVNKTDSNFEVLLPSRDAASKSRIKKDYVSTRSDVTQGYLPYTQANVIRQAFKLLGARYGWGGMYNGRDCSGFTHDVFLSMGIKLPRGSKEQQFVGTKLGFFKPFKHTEEKLYALDEAMPGITLLGMHQHMMLYLGKENDQYYVIHSTWAERYDMNSDKKNRINQVVVSDLTLNGRSYLGSLFDRLLSINEVR